MLLQVPKDPFFTNTIEGWIKVIGVFGGVAVGIITAIWKMMRGPLQATDAAISDRVTNLEQGMLQKAEKEQQIEARIAMLERNEVLLTANLRGIDATSGRIEQQNNAVLAELGNLRDKVHEAKVETVEKIALMQGQLSSMNKGG